MAAEKLKPARPSPFVSFDDAIEIRADAVGAALLEGVAGRALLGGGGALLDRSGLQQLLDRLGRRGGFLGSAAMGRLPSRRSRSPAFPASRARKSHGRQSSSPERRMQVPRMAPRILLSSKESIVGSGSRPERSTEGRQNGRGCASGISFRAAPSAGLRYRFARALATRINAPTFRQSPLFPACFRRPADLVPDDRNPHSGADSRPHGGDPPARQAAAGYRRPADDRPRAAAGRGGRESAGWRSPPTRPRSRPP